MDEFKWFVTLDWKKHGIPSFKHIMKNFLFTGGSSLLAQGWVRNSQNQYNYVLALNQRQIDRDKFSTIDMDYSSVSKIKSKLNC